MTMSATTALNVYLCASVAPAPGIPASPQMIVESFGAPGWKLLRAVPVLACDAFSAVVIWEERVHLAR
ncbi:hypothetical protein DMH25_42355 [Streptomyces sp. WAC 01325]|nr:hypothetical protein DMH25_42355 [Streptomyces sp. WAC 01325]